MHIKNKDLPSDPYLRLAAAIVAQAAEDYQTALRSGDKDAQNELLDFFHSDWYHMLTNINPDYLIRKMNEEAGI